LVTPVKKKRDGLLVYLVGLTGVICLGIAAAGLLGAFEPTPLVAKRQAAEAPAAEVPVSILVPVAAVSGAVLAQDTHHPLEVGRYWIYVSEDPQSGVRTEVERRIVRRESRPDQDLFYFSDVTVAFRQDDKIFEMGPEGGVNVIPLSADPYVYRSEGLHIEKQIGSRDTVLIPGEQRFAHCVQVITRFRPGDQPEQSPCAYASYYALGIGLVGRETWPPAPGGAPAQILRDYGPRKL
jgi:hypothetical protein